MSNTKMTNADAVALLIDAIVQPPSYVNTVNEIIGMPSPSSLHEVYSMRRARLYEAGNALAKSYRSGWSVKIHFITRSSVFYNIVLQQHDSRYRAVRFSVTGNVAELDAGGGLRFTGTLDYTTKELDTITQDLNKWLASFLKFNQR